MHASAVRARFQIECMLQNRVTLIPFSLFSQVPVLEITHITHIKYWISCIHMDPQYSWWNNYGRIIMPPRIPYKWRNYATDYASIIYGSKAQLC